MSLSQSDDGAVTLLPFGKDIRARATEEKVFEEVYQSIPALAAIADTTVALSNRITSDARNALFFSAAGVDPSLRELPVELAFKRRHDMEQARPDADYMAGMQPAKRDDFAGDSQDDWIPKMEPGKP